MVKPCNSIVAVSKLLSDVPLPPRIGKVEASLSNFRCTPPIEIGLNINAIEQTHFKRGHQVHFTIYPPPFPVPLSDSMPEQETGEFQFQMDMDIWTRTQSTTPQQPPKT